MTAKQKANELIFKFTISTIDIAKLSKRQAKKCALILANSLEESQLNMFSNMLGKNVGYAIISHHKSFWQEVKIEIENI